MLDYLSDYRTQDKMRGIHYYPSGALCWFETNAYGDPTGKVYYVRKVPNMELIKIPRRQRGLARLLEQQNKQMKLNQKFAKERADTEQWFEHKPRFDK